MTFSLEPGKLGFKLGEVLVGLQSGTTDTPETIDSTQHALHVLGYYWNANTLSYEVGTSGGSGTGSDVFVTNQISDDPLRVDVVDTIIYLGYADPGTATSSASWKIKRIDVTSGAISTWADGNVLYDNVWDNRVSLSYS